MCQASPHTTTLAPPHTPKVQSHSISRCAKVAPFCAGDFLLCLHVVACEWRTRWGRHEKAAATKQTVATARASERREPTLQEPGTRYHDLDDVSVPELGGSRPDRLSAVSGPQERVQRHTVEQMADGAPVLPMLEAPVPLMVEQLVEVLKILDNSLPDVEQVIEVPKIFSDVIPSRSSVSEPQLAEQLVEVPTLVSPSLPVDEKEEDTIVAVVCDAMGRTWFQVSGPRGRWWLLSGTQHTQWNHPKGYTTRPGRDTNTGRRDDGWFYGPLYLAVTCSVRRLRSTCVVFSRRRLLECVRFQRFSVRQWIHVAASLRRRRFRFRIQRNAWFDRGYKFCVSLRRISRFST